MTPYVFQSFMWQFSIATMDPLSISVKDEHVDCSKLQKIAVWPLPAPQLLQQYTACFVKKIIYGWARCLGQDVHTVPSGVNDFLH